MDSCCCRGGEGGVEGADVAAGGEGEGESAADEGRVGVLGVVAVDGVVYAYVILATCCG